MPVIELDVKAVEVLFAARCDVSHKSLRCFTGLFCGNHDGRAVGVVRTNEVHLVALHTLKSHPDIGLDVFHDVPDMELAIGVGKGGGDEYATLSHGCVAESLLKT